MDTPWFTVRNVDEVPSPALLFYPDRIEENVRRMLALVGSPARLRPHMKTHKDELEPRQSSIDLIPY